MRDLAFSRCHSGGYQLIDDEWTGHNQASSTHLVHQGRRDRGGTRRGEGYRQ
jgi:hypothetical protein